MKRILLLLLPLCLSLSLSAQDTLTIKNSSIAIQPNLAPGAPYSFMPIFRYDTTANTLYVFQDGAWTAVSSGGGGLSDGDYGDVTVSGSGTAININTGVVDTDELASTSVTSGSYTAANITVDADGRITSAADGNGATSTISNNANGSYEHDNGAGVVTTFGYQLTSSGDTVWLLDYDNTVVDFVVVSADYTPPTVTQSTATSSNTISLNNKFSGIYDLNFGSVTSGSITFTSGLNGGEYILWIEGCSSDSITFQSNALTIDRDSMSSRLCTTNERLDFFYDGTNYIFTDTFWAPVTVPDAGITDPTDISGLVAWYVADSISVGDGNPVGTWEDLSGQGNDLTQATGGLQPLLDVSVVNGHAVVDFDGSDDEMQSDTLATPSAGTMFVVFDPQTSRANTNADLVVSFRVDANNNIDVYEDTSQRYKHKAGGTTLEVTETGLTSGTFYYVDMQWSEIDDEFQAFRNGTQVSTTQTSLGTYAGTPTIMVGNVVGGNAQADDRIAEIIIYNTRLSASDAEDVRDYLAAKYGL